jgi:hypothetical protein
MRDAMIGVDDKRGHSSVGITVNPGDYDTLPSNIEPIPIFAYGESENMTGDPGASFSVPSEYAKNKQAQVLDKRDFDLAVECMKLAVDLHKGNAAITDAQLCTTAEWIWRWTNGESELPYGTWPKPESAV